MSDLPNISVIIPALNEERFLPGTLAALKALDYPAEKVQIIVVDNGSQDKTVQIAEQHGALVVRGDGEHVGALRNRGMAKATSEILAFLDADCVPNKDWLTRAVDMLNSMPNTERCITGADYFLPSPPHWIERVWYPPFPEGRRRVPYINSGNLIMFREDCLKIGGFDETLSSGEDYEFGVRANKIVPVIADTSIRVVHYGNPKTLKGFFRRELWHGLGALRTLRDNPLDKPLLATFVFVIGTLFQVLGLLRLLFGGSESFFVFGTLLVMLMLGIGVAFRIKRFPQQQDYPQLLLLLYVYLLGRSLALLRMLNPFSNRRRIR